MDVKLLKYRILLSKERQNSTDTLAFICLPVR